MWSAHHWTKNQQTCKKDSSKASASGFRRVKLVVILKIMPGAENTYNFHNSPSGVNGWLRIGLR